MTTEQTVSPVGNPKKYRRLLLPIVIVSAIFQFGNIGWFLIIFGILFLLAFIFHTVGWLRWLRDGNSFSPFDRGVFIINNAAFLVGNVFNYDFGDTGAYMFFFQLTDPPDYLIWIGTAGQVTWLATFLGYFVYQFINWLKSRRGL